MRKGFTLLELLIYIGVLSLLMVVIANAFISLSQGQGQSEVRSDINGSMRFASERMKQDIKNAGALTTPTLGTPGPSLSLVVGGVTVIYDTVGGVLRRTEGPGAPVPITGSGVFVNTPTFTRLENYSSFLQATTTSVKISLTMNTNASSTDKQYTRSLETSISLR